MEHDGPTDFDKGVPFSELTLQTQPAPYEYANDGQRPSWRRSGRSRGRCGSAGEDLPWPARLTAKLAEFEAAGLALQEAHGHLRRAETDEAAALDSSGSDADDKIAVAIRNRGIDSSGLRTEKRLERGCWASCPKRSSLVNPSWLRRSRAS